MPCGSDYMEPTALERKLQETARYLVYVRRQLSFVVPKNLEAAANNQYCKDDYVPELCAIINKMTEEQKKDIIYNAYNRIARNLANWWEEHQEADATRKANEMKTKKRESLRKSAMAKLTAAELAALGLSKKK